MSKHSIQGKVDLVAGGAKNGLLSRALAEKGAKAVVVHYNSESTCKAAEETVAAVKALGADALAVQADLSIAANSAFIFERRSKSSAEWTSALTRPGLSSKSRSAKSPRRTMKNASAPIPKPPSFSSRPPVPS